MKNLVPLPVTALKLRVPLPFSVYDSKGLLLLAKGSVVVTEAQRLELIQRNAHISETESEQFQRALAGKLDDLVRQNAPLKQLATATPDRVGPAVAPERPTDPINLWSELQSRASALLRETQRDDWLARLMQLQAEVLEQVDRDADAALFLLIQSTSTEVRGYSATHALLVTVVCELAARCMADWDEPLRQSLRCAALSMNLAMTQLQDRLSQQDQSVSPEQRAVLNRHPERTRAMLQAAGVQDPHWLEAVTHHHNAAPGPMVDRPPALRLARLIQRCDIFAARLSTRANRKALSATAAAQAIYTDELKQPDEAGGAIIKAVGLYPPGSFVRLGNGEVAVVLERGRRANEPRVASIVGREGMPLGEPAPRDTRLPPFNTTGGVAPHEVKVTLNAERIFKLR